ncbi:MAG: hypothetical protein HY735_16945 [Verrucomicrobia bacterium]|nr:hypothetical protein [Verrucomicrobiota bacterium]
MNAPSLKLKIAATDQRDSWEQQIPIRHGSAARGAAPQPLPISRRLTEEPAESRCPHCDSIIYSRRHKLCGLCGQALPEELRFSASEVERLENILRTEQQRHRVWMKRNALSVFAGGIVAS